MKKIYTDEQFVGFVREAEKTEVTIAGFCRQKDLTKALSISGKSVSVQCRSLKSNACASLNRRMPDLKDYQLTA